jgi:integrase/recombinase XerD
MLPAGHTAATARQQAGQAVTPRPRAEPSGRHAISAQLRRHPQLPADRDPPLLRLRRRPRPRHADLCRRVPGIPVKKTSSSSLTYLDRDEVKALLAAPSPADRPGLRDRALLTLLYNTGARASEAAGLDINDVRLQTPSQVRIFGKGRKERVCPLWQESADAVRAHLDQRDDRDRPGAPLFLNAHGKRITRFGLATILQRHVAAAASRQASLASKLVSPHTIRHSTALHLLQARVELNVIKSWLGHVSITTTSEASTSRSTWP